MRIVKENKVQEAVKPMDFSVQFSSKGNKKTLMSMLSMSMDIEKV